MSLERPKTLKEQGIVPESRENNQERERKKLKALLAIGGALLWGEIKFLSSHDPLPLTEAGELSEEEAKKVEKQGWLKTMAEKAQDYYGTLTKYESVLFEGKLEDIFDKKPERQ